MPNPLSALTAIKKMFSPLERAVVGHKLETMPSAQWASYIKANAPKSAKKEAIAVKLDELLARQPKVTKQEIVQHIRDNSPKINTRVLKNDPYSAADISSHRNIEPNDSGGYRYIDDSGDVAHESWGTDAMVDYLNRTEGAKFGEYTLPGGENYQEMLLSLPRNKSQGVIRKQNSYEITDPATGMPVATGQMPMSARMVENLNNNPNWVVREFEQVNPNDVRRDTSNFYSSHYDEPNIVAHMRMNDRPTAEGKKALFLEELQSDWAQKGRGKGFKDTPRAPYVEDTGDWTALGLKKAIEHAVERGHDSVAWTTGAQQADRYGLAKQIDSIHHNVNPDGTYSFSAIKNGRVVASKEGLTPDELAEHLGQGVAAKIMKSEGNSSPSGTSVGWQAEPSIYGAVDTVAPQYKTMSGLDLNVGGEGMRGYYDQIVPQTANDILKSMGVAERVKPIGVQLDDNVSQHMGFDITPEMREKVMNEGLPAFASGGRVEYDLPKAMEGVELKYYAPPVSERRAMHQEREESNQDILDKILNRLQFNASGTGNKYAKGLSGTLSYTHPIDEDNLLKLAISGHAYKGDGWSDKDIDSGDIRYIHKFAVGGEVEANDVDYDSMYEFKKNEPAFAEGGEVDYDAMYEFR